MSGDKRGGGLETLRPAHTRKYAQFSDEWYLANQRAFATAMQDEIRRQQKERPNDRD